MIKTCQIIALVLSLFFFFNKAYAVDLLFPVSCRIMENCWITNHVDLNKNINQVEDYMCGKKVSDNNQSTHISLASKSSYHENIPVLATAEGIVRVAELDSGFCGGRVLIEHKDGWQSSYCHLNPELITVIKGQKVKAGDVLGLIGVSGQSQWPHLSFAVLRNGMVFDPFSGRTPLEGCLKASTPLWEGGMNPLYEPAHVTNIGFTVGHVTNQEITSGAIAAAKEIATNTPQISLWAMLMNISSNDDISLKIEEPSGRILNQLDIKIKNDADFHPIYFVTRRQNFLWDEGLYKGTITITRNVNGNRITIGKYTSVTLIETD